ncbi:recombination protein RecR [Haematospirillum jordaniae]|uniref:recombination mediator RecR n=1 Tax=Haematospirillum jordaniae TaxID=1549855 RepID=UPI0014333485|nr:recombination mediator RecR [Haematospirillum jordaniae]NKD45031.1 recombination protein RecR [Haematospirillum jordaniae]NKD92754.1 recombination protein RecR [Haematospirillum jordaniae]
MVSNPIERLTRLVARLPGLGPRSARRVVLHLLRRRETVLTPLITALEEVERAVRVCPECGNLDMQAPCSLCEDHRRDPSVICVVEHVDDLWALERSGAFSGHYHVLGGLLSAVNGTGPEDLRLNGLTERIQKKDVQEVILALPATLDGQTTAHYIADTLRPLPIATSGLARGVPVGGELNWLDDGTLVQALKARRPM